jgi:prolyl 4-hydroxylase
MLLLRLLLLTALASTAGGWKTEPDNDRLPGWQGEVQRGARKAATKGEQYAKEDRERGTWVELISWRPRAYVIHNFMAPEECVQIIKTAKPFMTRSTVVDSVTGESKVDPIRTRHARAFVVSPTCAG